MRDTKGIFHASSVQSLSHVQLCDPMNSSTPGLPVRHQLPGFTQTHVQCSLGVSNFLEEICSLSHSIAFLYFFALSSEEVFFYLPLLYFGTLHSNGFIFAFLLCFLLLVFSQLFVSPPQTAILPFCISFLGVWFSYGPIWPPYRWVALLKELPWCLSGKESPCQCRRHRFDSWVGKIHWMRAWHSILVFLPGKFRGQRSLAGYNPWGHRESDTTEQTHP